MKRFKNIIFVLMIAFVIFGGIQSVLAFDTKSTGLDDTGKEIYGTTPAANQLETTVGKVIQGLLALLGLVLFIVVIYGGILYMTAGGDTTKTKEAKGWIVNGIIGLVIISLAYAISTYVLSTIVTVTGA